MESDILLNRTSPAIPFPNRLQWIAFGLTVDTRFDKEELLSGFILLLDKLGVG